MCKVTGIESLRKQTRKNHYKIDRKRITVPSEREYESLFKLAGNKYPQRQGKNGCAS